MRQRHSSRAATPISAFARLYGPKLLLVLACPLLLIVGVICGMIGHLTNLPYIVQLGVAAWSVAMILLLPLGIVALLLSWRMARIDAATGSDTRDVVEFLLGSSGFVMTVLGAILSPSTYWLAFHL